MFESNMMNTERAEIHVYRAIPSLFSDVGTQMNGSVPHSTVSKI